MENWILSFNFRFVFHVAVGEYNFPMTRETHMKMYQKYGPIVREYLGDENFIRLFDPQVSTSVNNPIQSHLPIAQI